MKTLFKKILSALLAVLCFGGMFAAAAETPAAEGEFRPFQTSEEYDDTGKNILPDFRVLRNLAFRRVRSGNSGEQHRDAV